MSGDPTVFQIWELESAMHRAQCAYLKRFGWTQTNDTPGGFWLWVRDFSDLDKKLDAAPYTAMMRDAERAALHEPSHERFGRMAVDIKTAVMMTRQVLDNDTQFGVS